jgi:CheY-like chemotaxis protein
VSDTGQGISREFLPYVFERFRQADSSATRKHAGLGLGLSIVRYLVEHHGGSIEAQSAGEGQGATFRVMFPRLTQNNGISKPAVANSPDYDGAISAEETFLEGLRILVVDDDADFRDVITAMLLQAKAEVLTVASCAEALEALELWDPDVMLADIEMPGEDGYSLLRKVRTLEPNRGGLIPAAALTAYGSPQDRVRALKAGYQIYLSKPVDPHELTVVVAKLAQQREVRKSVTTQVK